MNEGGEPLPSNNTKENIETAAMGPTKVVRHRAVPVTTGYRDITLLPPSEVNLCRILTSKLPCPKRMKSSRPWSCTVAPIMALGANTRASPTESPTISLKRQDVFADIPSAFNSVCAVDEPCVAPAKCFCRDRSHSGDVKRCTMVIEQRFSKDVEIVGS